MQVLSAEEHRAVDRATMKRDGVDSLQLMERAATAWATRFQKLHARKQQDITVLSGPGNNGGDGLVIARLLRFAAYDSVNVITAEIADPSPDNQRNRRRAKDVGVPLRSLYEGDALPSFRPGSIVIDALFGTGLSRPIEGYWAELIEHLNRQPVRRVAVDLPSGLLSDGPSSGAIVRADLTLSLGYPKLALYSPANTSYLGYWELVDFPLAEPPHNPEAAVQLTEREVANLLRPRHANDHKGTFGHALLVAGAFEKMGAAIICARAVLRAGAGLVTTHIPRVGYEIMQISFPEAMCSVDRHRYHFTGIDAVAKYDTVGVGPGIGKDSSTRQALYALIEAYDRPMVIDADALNLLSEASERLEQLPARSVLTPHPKEFERLFGKTENDFARWRVQRERAAALGLVIVLKTGFTSIATPDGKLYFNTTGNPGMGTGGTGDALTGVITGLLAQGYEAAEAARLGVYLHGLAGDLAAEEVGQESLIAEDLVLHLGAAYLRLHSLREQYHQ